MFGVNFLANSAALSRNVASMLVSPVRKSVLDQFGNTTYPSNLTQDFLQALWGDHSLDLALPDTGTLGAATHYRIHDPAL